MSSPTPSRHPRNRSLLREVLLGTLLLMGPVGLAVAYTPFNEWFDNTLTLTTSNETQVVRTEPVLVLPDETPTPQPTVPANQASPTRVPPTTVPGTAGPVPPTPASATPTPARPTPDDTSITPGLPGADRAFETLDAADG